MDGFISNLVGDIGSALGLTSGAGQQQPSPAQQQIASNAFPRIQPSQFTQFGPDSGSTQNLSPAQNAGLSGSDSTPTSPSGSHPSDGAASDGGWTSTLTHMLDSPLTQGLASAYFGAISQPKHTSLPGRLGLGGLQGLQAYNQARTQQLDIPYQQAQLQQLQAQTKQAQLASQLAQRKLAPIPQSMMQDLDKYAQQWQQVANAPGSSDIQKQVAQSNLMHIQGMKDLAAANMAGPDEMLSFMDSIDPAKQYGEAAKAGLSQEELNMFNQFMHPGGGGGGGGQQQPVDQGGGQQYQPGTQTTKYPPGKGPGYPGTDQNLPAQQQTPPQQRVAGVPPTGPAANLDPKQYKTWNAAGSTLAQSSADGQTYLADKQGTWHPVYLKNLGFKPNAFATLPDGRTMVHKPGDGNYIYVQNAQGGWDRVAGKPLGS
jgi:hypothetical protein